MPTKKLRGNRNDGDLARLGSVAPEDAVRAWSLILSIGLEDLPRRVEGMF